MEQFKPKQPTNGYLVGSRIVETERIMGFQGLNTVGMLQVRQLEGDELQLENDIQDIRDQNELLEFRILELEVKTVSQTFNIRMESSRKADMLSLCFYEKYVSYSGEGTAVTCHQLSTAPFPRRPQSLTDILRFRGSHCK